MSDWIHVTGYMVISDGLPCRIGKYGKPFDEVISDEEFMRMWNGEICGMTVSDMLGKLIIAMTNRWMYFTDKPYNPLGFHDRIFWKKPIMEDNGLYVGDEEEEEWFRWDEQKLKDKPLLECLQFPCGSEGPLDVTVTPHIDEWGTSWHIVFNGNLRDRDSSYFEHVKSWWEAMQTMFNVGSGYICCTWLDEKWKEEI
jgi:hypothetical protein